MTTIQTMRKQKLFLSALAVVPIVLMTASAGYAFQSQNANAAYAIGLWGDLPYSEVQASVGVPNKRGTIDEVRARTNGRHNRRRSSLDIPGPPKGTIVFFPVFSS